MTVPQSHLSSSCPIIVIGHPSSEVENRKESGVRSEELRRSGETICVHNPKGMTWDDGRGMRDVARKRSAERGFSNLR